MRQVGELWAVKVKAAVRCNAAAPLLTTQNATCLSSDESFPLSARSAEYSMSALRDLLMSHPACDRPALCTIHPCFRNCYQMVLYFDQILRLVGGFVV